jgi:hypothetical protein
MVRIALREDSWAFIGGAGAFGGALAGSFAFVGFTGAFIDLATFFLSAFLGADLGFVIFLFFLRATTAFLGLALFFFFADFGDAIRASSLPGKWGIRRT